MCGIVGFAGGLFDLPKKKEVLNQQMDVIKHRGPSGDGDFIDDKVALGFRRLSIIDLAKGDQPIYNEDHTKLVFFNGEIYNYREMRTELIALGHDFKTDSDTETILQKCVGCLSLSSMTYKLSNYLVLVISSALSPFITRL